MWKMSKQPVTNFQALSTGPLLHLLWMKLSTNGIGSKLRPAQSFEKEKGGMKSATWKAAYDKSSDTSIIMLIIDILLTLQPTSVACKTCFSQMKLVRTSRRRRLQNKTLKDLLVVRLASPAMQDFNPDEAIDHWMNSSVGGRRFTYKRQKVNINVDVDSDDE